jgi:hypothetical protein
MICQALVSTSSLLTQNSPAYRRTVSVFDMSTKGYSFRLLLILIILLAFSWAKNSISLSRSPVKESWELPLHYGDEGTRTPDLLRAREALSHLSYIPVPMGLTRLELVTFPLSEGCSNRLSYRPMR